MPTRGQVEVGQIERILNLVLDRSQPPVGRCRLLSSGFAPHHTLNIGDDITGTKACLGCGNCLEVCPVLAREPRRQLRTEQRTSLALEVLVGEDCDRCYNCVLVCPQVDTTIKHYVVNTRLAEGLAQLLAKAAADDALYFDLLMTQ